MIFSPKNRSTFAISSVWPVGAPQACFTRVFKGKLGIFGGPRGLRRAVNRESKLKSWSETRSADDLAFSASFWGVEI